MMLVHIAKAVVFLALAGLWVPAGANEDGAQHATAEKQVTFYHSYGYQENAQWTIPLRLWVWKAPDLKRRASAKLAREYLAARAGTPELSESEKEIFERNSRGFVAGNQSKELVRFAFDNDPEREEFFVFNDEGEMLTNRNGLLEGSLRLDQGTADRLLKAQGSQRGWLRFRATSDAHQGVGYAQLIQPSGLSVISDVDDTVKVTGIPDGESTVLRNTFFRSYEAAPCMAELYGSFGEDVAFHYVSGGPWQLYPPIDEFLFSQAVGFPRGSFHMKNLRTNPFEKESYQDIWNILVSGSKQATFDQKISQLTTIIEHFPGRRFILIGDSGEKDPEVFAQIRDAFPEQIVEIFIRRVTDEEESDPGRLSGMTTIPQAPDGEGSCTELIKALPLSCAGDCQLPRGSGIACTASRAGPGGKDRVAGRRGQTDLKYFALA
jgi:hypothetical protein